MKLFDIFERTDLSPAKHGESLYSYWNRSARLEFSQAREIVETWFAQYPYTHKPEFSSKFRSNIYHQHQAALFELVLHQLLIELNCEVQIHPVLKGTDYSPDFFVKPRGDDPFYLEATVATYKSAQHLAAEARIQTVYDILNRKLVSPNFYLWLEVEGAPNTQPSANKIVKFLNQKLADLDPDEVTLAYEQNGIESLPTWVYTHENWQIIFRPLPKKPEARGKSGVQPLGMFSSGIHSVNHRTPLKSSVLDKASKYGYLQHPYIVAVLVLERIDEIDIMEALFGKEQFTIDISGTTPMTDESVRMSRVPDGVWTNYSGPKNSRLSAVLIVQQLNIWNINSATVRLYHNPWANRPHSSVLCQLPEALPKDDKLQLKEGRSIADILHFTQRY